MSGGNGLQKIHTKKNKFCLTHSMVLHQNDEVPWSYLQELKKVSKMSRKKSKLSYLDLDYKILSFNILRENGIIMQLNVRKP